MCIWLQKRAVGFTGLSKAREMELSVGEYIFEMLSGDSDDYRLLESFLEVTE